MALGFTIRKRLPHSCQVLACIPSIVMADNDISHKQTTLNHLRPTRESIVVLSIALISHH